MEIRRLNKKALQEFIDSEEFNSLPLIPVTKYRALSHWTNPRAADDDVLLLMAFEDDKMVGYLGVLADHLYDGDKIYKVGWLSASGVDPNQRRKGIAGKLLHAALDSWNNQILVADWVPSSFGVYEKSGAFAELAHREGVEANIRFNLRENYPAKTLPKRIFLVAADKILNAFNAVRLLFALRDNHPLYEKVDSIDNESVKFMSRWKNSELFRRSEKDYAWILKYPWVLQKSSEYPQRDERFIFSSVCNEFRHEVIKIRNSRKEMIALLMLTVRNKSLQIPYVYYQSEHVEAVARFIYRYMYEKGIKGMVSYDSRLSEYILTNKTPFISRHKTGIPYIITKSLAEKLKDSGKTIQDGDGERVFT
ncbi:MAG: GNAT family N-acetyltransferase [Syntrophomonas sp.]